MSEGEYNMRREGDLGNRRNYDEGMMGTIYPREMSRVNDNVRDSSTYGEYNRMSELEGSRRGEMYLDNRRSWGEESMEIRYPREGSSFRDYGREPSMYGEYNGMPIRKGFRGENMLDNRRYWPEEPMGIRYPREKLMNSRAREPSMYGEYNRMSIKEEVGSENRLDYSRKWPEEPMGIRHPRHESMDIRVRDPNMYVECNGISYSEGTRSDGWEGNGRDVDEWSMGAHYSTEESMNRERGRDSSMNRQNKKMSGREGSIRKEWFDDRESKESTGIKYERDEPMNWKFDTNRKQPTHREYNTLNDSVDGTNYFKDAMINSRHRVPEARHDELEKGSMESGYKRNFLDPYPKEENSFHTDVKPEARNTYFESNRIMNSDYQFRDRGNKEASGISERGGYSDVYREKETNSTPSGNDQFGNRVDKEYYRRWVYAGEDPMGLFVDYNHPKYWRMSNGKLSIDREDILNRMGRPKTRDRY